MIKLDKNTDLKSLEEKLKSINNDDLWLSFNININEFGLTGALVQFVTTWFNKTKTTDAKIVLDFDLDDQIEKFYELDFFFPSIVYCWSRQIQSKSGKDIKAILKQHNEVSHKKMQSNVSGGGPKLSLSCFDHLSVKKGLLNVFYNGDEFISNEVEFDFVFDKSLNKVLTVNKEQNINNFRPIRDDLVSIIYELIKNTDDWAKTDLKGKPLPASTRGLFMKVHRQTLKTYTEKFSKNVGLENYFNSNKLESNNKGEVNFLELSIYDSGIGYVKRYNDNDNGIGIYQQVETVKKCLTKNVTSAQGIEGTKKGLGLEKILNLLRGKGFFMLRTENVFLFKDLSSLEVEDQIDLTLFDWISNTNNYTKLESVTGAVVSIVYPLSNLLAHE